VPKVLCAIPVRKPAVVLRALVETLRWQTTRDPVRLDILFAPNYPEGDPDAADALAVLHEFATDLDRVTVWPNDPPPPGDYGDGPVTRAWQQSAFDRLAEFKNRLLAAAIKYEYDFLWLVDADVLCAPDTLQSLLDAAEVDEWKLNPQRVLPIVAGVYWTQWQRPREGTTDRVHAGPQVWLVHPYKLAGRGWTEPAFREALVTRQRVRVWGLGACTLIPRAALLKGVSFARFDGLPPGPMSEGEDRHFCAHANQKHITLVADGWPDIYHAYHAAEYDQIDAAMARLSVRPKDCATLGDLISAKVEVLEPVPDRGNRFMRVSAKFVRGRLGSLPVLPQLEEAIANLHCGESRILKVQFPAHWPEPQLQLKSVLMRVTLFSAKPFGLPPVIDTEFFVDHKTGALIDHTTHTEAQLQDIAND